MYFDERADPIIRIATRGLFKTTFCELQEVRSAPLKEFSSIKVKSEINSTAILEIESFIEKKGFKTPITKRRNRY